MKGTSNSSVVNSTIISTTRRSVYETWLKAGLVHHAPLVAGEVLPVGQRGHIPAIVHEEQRLRVIRLIEVVARQQQSVEGTGLCQAQQVAHHVGHWTVVAVGDRDLAVCHLGVL